MAVTNGRCFDKRQSQHVEKINTCATIDIRMFLDMFIAHRLTHASAQRAIFGHHFAEFIAKF